MAIRLIRQDRVQGKTSPNDWKFIIRFPPSSLRTKITQSSTLRAKCSARCMFFRSGILSRSRIRPVGLWDIRDATNSSELDCCNEFIRRSSYLPLSFTCTLRHRHRSGLCRGSPPDSSSDPVQRDRRLLPARFLRLICPRLTATMRWTSLAGCSLLKQRRHSGSPGVIPTTFDASRSTGSDIRGSTL